MEIKRIIVFLFFIRMTLISKVEGIEIFNPYTIPIAKRIGIKDLNTTVLASKKTKLHFITSAR